MGKESYVPDETEEGHSMLEAARDGLDYIEDRCLDYGDRLISRYGSEDAAKFHILAKFMGPQIVAGSLFTAYASGQHDLRTAAITGGATLVGYGMKKYYELIANVKRSSYEGGLRDK